MWVCVHISFALNIKVIFFWIVRTGTMILRCARCSILRVQRGRERCHAIALPPAREQSGVVSRAPFISLFPQKLPPMTNLREICNWHQRTENRSLYILFSSSRRLEVWTLRGSLQFLIGVSGSFPYDSLLHRFTFYLQNLWQVINIIRRAQCYAQRY